jgi:hypothetical protein
MDNSIHLLSKFSVWKRQFGLRSLGDNEMFTKTNHKDTTFSHRTRVGQQTSRFANLVSLIKNPNKRTSSSIRMENLEKEIRYTRPVDIGTLNRSR